MGLDGVEIVIRIEEAFEISISDEAAETLTTPGEIVNYLTSLPKVNEKWSREYLEDTVWQILEDEIGIDRKDYNENSRLVQDMGMD